MNQHVMVVVIVALAMGFAAFKEWTKVRAKEANAKATNLDNAATARIAELEERVKVLERIATDKSSRLGEEIDAL